MLPTKFWSIWPSCVREEDFLEIYQSEKKNCLVVAMFVNRLGQNEQYL
jgi:hypothetical protein